MVKNEKLEFTQPLYQDVTQGQFFKWIAAG